MNFLIIIFSPLQSELTLPHKILPDEVIAKSVVAFPEFLYQIFIAFDDRYFLLLIGPGDADTRFTMMCAIIAQIRR